MLSSLGKKSLNFFIKEINHSPGKKTCSIITSPARNMSHNNNNNNNNNDNNTEERKLNVQGLDINYVKVGSGSHPLLLLPGALGSIWTDFKPQVAGLDRNKFTIVAWDPPGYGNSRPPNRNFGNDFFYRDASLSHDFMKKIGFHQFSIIGWSDGGITSLLLASKYPESIKKMIIVGANAYILPEEIETYKSVRNIDSWSERMRAPMISVYGEGYFRSTWASWVDAMVSIYEKNNGDICKNALPNIKCPTLIVHGAKDVMVHKNHPQFLADNIENSKVEIFENGSHTPHLKFHKEFNKLATEFLIDN